MAVFWVTVVGIIISGQLSRGAITWAPIVQGANHVWGQIPGGGGGGEQIFGGNYPGGQLSRGPLSCSHFNHTNNVCFCFYLAKKFFCKR